MLTGLKQKVSRYQLTDYINNSQDLTLIIRLEPSTATVCYRCLVSGTRQSDKQGCIPIELLSALRKPAVLHLHKNENGEPITSAERPSPARRSAGSREQNTACSEQASLGCVQQLILFAWVIYSARQLAEKQFRDSRSTDYNYRTRIRASCALFRTSAVFGEMEVMRAFGVLFLTALFVTTVFGIGKQQSVVVIIIIIIIIIILSFKNLAVYISRLKRVLFCLQQLHDFISLITASCI